MRYLAIFFTLLQLLTPVHCLGDSPLVIEWQDLISPKYQKQDLIGHLPGEERDHVEWIIFLRETLPEKITPKDEIFYKEMRAALPKLKKQGIDVDEIIAMRRMREKSVNSELNGKQVQMAGYLLPLDFTSDTIREFLLVPTIGACIHVPPPPPNQIIHATTETPVKFKVEEMFKPVWATGVLQAKSFSKEIFLVDGTGDIAIGYILKLEQIDPYEGTFIEP